MMGAEMHQVVGLEIEPWEVIVKMDNGYQLLRYGWTWMPPNVRPRPSELSKPKWKLVEMPTDTFQSAELYSKGVPIINGPVEVTDGAEIMRI